MCSASRHGKGGKKNNVFLDFGEYFSPFHGDLNRILIKDSFKIRKKIKEPNKLVFKSVNSQYTIYTGASFYSE